MTLAAILVHYRTPEALQRALRGLAEQSEPPAEVVVVDNGAGRGDPPPELPVAGWRWHSPGRNLGYGAAVNLGSRLVGGDALLVLNPDVVLERNGCEVLSRALAADSRHAIAAPRIYGRDGELEHNARAFPTPLTGIIGRASRLTAALNRIGHVPASLRSTAGRRTEVDWVSGACMLIRRSAFASAGGFDERYWLYWEDADLCRRLSASGWTVVFEPNTTAHHDTSSAGRSPATVRAFHESAALYARTHIWRGRMGSGLARALLDLRMRLLLRQISDGR
jgi:N-acetylglucosaminyl-diphospho-decaprenol L-rhamnosyltransferase